MAAGSLGLAALTVLTRHRRVRIRTVTVRLPRLPSAFDGYRILHMSDVHVGPMVPPERVVRWVEKANRLEPDLVALTGDYIVTGTEYHRAAASALSGLHAKDGVFASMGNHDYFGDGEAMARALCEAGLTVLRNRGLVIRRQGSELYLAGVDDTWSELADVPAAMAGRPAGAATVLLAHDPDLLPEAARHGVDLMLSGHTHGGQIGIPLLAKQLNFSRPITRLTAGIYREARTTLYVTRGVGTTFIPLRVGVPPELAVIVLRGS
jgi:predicted MPP superfamily phosphohydrolase